MQPGIDTTNPFSADAQAPESVGSGEVGASSTIPFQSAMQGTGMVEKKPMNWKHFGWGVGITIGYFVLFGILGAITDGVLMSNDGEGSMTIETDGNTTHFEVELPVEPDTCELRFSADEGSLWADAYSDCDEVLSYSLPFYNDNLNISIEGVGISKEIGNESLDEIYNSINSNFFLKLSILFTALPK